MNASDEGNAIRRLRIEKRLNQDELARRAGVNQSAICRLERGYQRPTPRVLEALVRALCDEEPRS